MSIGVSMSRKLEAEWDAIRLNERMLAREAENRRVTSFSSFMKKVQKSCRETVVTAIDKRTESSSQRIDKRTESSSQRIGNNKKTLEGVFDTPSQ
jgi:hypothetical protein